jgi:Fe-S cluster biogenesis protein NfuA
LTRTRHPCDDFKYGLFSATADMHSESNTSKRLSDPEIVDRIERVLDERVRPDLRSDGGGIELVGMDEDRIAQVRLTGACQGCSSSLITLTMRVESILKAAVPEIRFVEAVP